MADTVEYKFENGDKAIAQLDLLGNKCYVPVEIINVESVEKFSDKMIPKYLTKSLDLYTYSFHTLLETYLYTREGFLQMLDTVYKVK